MDVSVHSAASSQSPSPQPPPPPPPPGAGGGATAAGGANPPANPSHPSRKPPPQLAKLREANAKYKQLLKLAKGRIQEQEGLLDEQQAEAKKLAAQLNEAQQHIDTLQTATAGASGGGSSSLDPNETTIVRVCQRIKEDALDDSNSHDDANDDMGDADARNTDDNALEIWALIEYETTHDNDVPNNPLGAPAFRRHKQWQRFAHDAALADHIRRDTGEPLALPPYALSPAQSQRTERDAARAVAAVAEEFRRFRVRAGVAQKQADATVRALHASGVHATRQRIEGRDLESERAQARDDRARLAALRREATEQEARWKESYEQLLAENEQLKSSGAEALLAAQWRHRYEACLKEKEDATTNWNMEKEKVAELQDQRKRVDAGKYESKYRDLKESFRLYRKKAKEIFLAQQQGDTGFMPSLHDSGAEVAKISYLKNLMVNYLSADPAVRDHMEPAIGTVLNFTQEDLDKVKKQKEMNESWF